MMQLHAQPYDLAATGFNFETAEEYGTKAAALQNDYGEPVEEFEIQFEPYCLGKTTDPGQTGRDPRLFLEAVL